jgi:hypothetical protein
MRDKTWDIHIGFGWQKMVCCPCEQMEFLDAGHHEFHHHCA